MDIFDFSNYKKYVIKWVSEQPNKGYGQYSKMAQVCEVSSVQMSQTFKGSKNLSLEQALKLTHYLNHTQRERDYFLCLIQIERAGDQQLKNYYTKQAQQLKAQSLELKNRFKEYESLTEEAKSIFYSHWKYSAIRILSGIDGFDSVADIQSKLNLEEEVVVEAVEFLLEHGLCVLENGKLNSGPQTTFLEKGSPYIKARQIAWRLKAIEAMDKKNEDQLFFTAPMSLSEKDIPKVKKVLLTAIDEIMDIIKKSGAEEMVLFNIDFDRF